jgi:LysM repeat protein
MCSLKSSLRRIALLLAFTVGTLTAALPAIAQEGAAPAAGSPARPAYDSDSAHPAPAVRSAPDTSYARPAPVIAAPHEARDPRDLDETNPAPAPASGSATGSLAGSSTDAKPPSKPHKYFPYTVRAGDTLGTIAQYFALTTADLAHLNKLHEDDELEVGESLKIPNPFEASQRNLEAEVNQLSEQNRANEQKLEQAQSQTATLTNSNADLTGENATLKESVKVLPWWRGTALAVGAAALLMLGVTGLTLFEWWMLRRRFLALSDLAMSLSRLDVKYKETIAKAELRMQQLYGRRRPAGAPENPLGSIRTPDEIEVERLSHELRETLERHLKQLGVRGRQTIGARWREVLGGEEETAPVPPRPYRR